jgi:LacI family transcriptional regulator
VLGIQGGALQRCQEERYKVLFHGCDYRNRKLGSEIISLARQLHLEGLILTPPLSGIRRLVRELQASGLPLAQVAPPKNETGALNVLIDDVSAARTLTEHVLGLGHRRIGFIQGHPDHDAAAKRYTGYKDALRTARIALDPTLVMPGLFSFESGKAAALKLLMAADRPTAIIASNDDMAAGVMAVAHELGLRLPHDLSVCGFDDTPAARIVWPQLTTMHQPIVDMAYSATDLLLMKIRTGVTPPDPVRHCFTLVLRKSTAAPPSGRTQ